MRQTQQALAIFLFPKPTDWACFTTDSQKLIGQLRKKHFIHCAWLQNNSVIILQVNTAKTPAVSDQIKPVCQLFLDTLLPVWTACLLLISPTSPVSTLLLTACLCLHRLSHNGTPWWEEKREGKKKKMLHLEPLALYDSLTIYRSPPLSQPTQSHVHLKWCRVKSCSQRIPGWE